MIIFRADANSTIGMGHIMRCLSIADAMTSFSSEDIYFVLADESVRSLVEDRGYRTVILRSDYKNLNSEIELWPELHYDALIVDSYFVTVEYLSSLKAKTSHLVYIDDLAAFSYPVDILVNYNAYGPYMDYERLYSESGVDAPQFILGPSYAPLRAMFRGIAKRSQPPKVRNILISTGGSDELHLELNLLQCVRKKGGDVTYHFLIGAMNGDKEKIHTLADKQSSIVLHENVSDMKSLISSCDLSVSAAGSTLYEICACGVPLITYVIADNQIPGANAFEKLGLATNLGDMRGLTDDPCGRILTAIEELSDNYERRVETGSRMQKMIDGFGAERMARRIIAMIEG